MILSSLQVDVAELEQRTGWALKPQGACRAATGVLDHLRFVEDQQVPRLLPQRLDVAPQQRVRGEHHVVFADTFDMPVPLCALQGDGAGAHRHQAEQRLQ